MLEHPHVVDAYRDRPPAVQNGASHDRAVLGKGKGQTCCKLQAREVITTCDHLGFLCRAELEDEILREPLHVALHRLVKGSRCS